MCFSALLHARPAPSQHVSVCPRPQGGGTHRRYVGEARWHADPQDGSGRGAAAGGEEPRRGAACGFACGPPQLAAAQGKTCVPKKGVRTTTRSGSGSGLLRRTGHMDRQIRQVGRSAAVQTPAVLAHTQSKCNILNERRVLAWSPPSRAGPVSGPAAAGRASRNRRWESAALPASSRRCRCRRC